MKTINYIRNSCLALIFAAVPFLTPADVTSVYLFTGPPTDTGYFTGVYRSYNSGGNFYLRSNYPNVLGYASNGWDIARQTTYDLAIAVSRTTNSTLIIGGINTWRSTDYASN